MYKNISFNYLNSFFFVFLQVAFIHKGSKIIVIIIANAVFKLLPLFVQVCCYYLQIFNSLPLDVHLGLRMGEKLKTSVPHPIPQGSEIRGFKDGGEVEDICVPVRVFTDPQSVFSRMGAKLKAEEEFLFLVSFPFIFIFLSKYSGDKTVIHIIS